MAERGFESKASAAGEAPAGADESAWDGVSFEADDLSLASLTLSERAREANGIYLPMDSGVPYVYDVPSTPARRYWRVLRNAPVYDTPRYPPRAVASCSDAPCDTMNQSFREYEDRFPFQSPRPGARPPLPKNPPPSRNRVVEPPNEDVGRTDLHSMRQTPKGFLKAVPRRRGSRTQGGQASDRREAFALSPGGGRGTIGSNIRSLFGFRGRSATTVTLPRQLMVPLHLIRPAVAVDYRNAYFVYLEGPMGVGKTTLINTVCGILPGERVVNFPEPMNYWTQVFTDCHRDIYTVIRTGKAGDPGTSARIYACQCKFALPFRTTGAAVRRMVQPWRVGGEATRGTHWCLSDRHLLSPTVVFPLLHLKLGRLCFDHFFQLIASFRAMEGDIVTIVALRSAETLRRLKARGRKCEGNVDQDYVREVAWAYHAVYCTWIMLQYITVEQMVQLCVQTTNVPEICFRSSRLAHKEDVLKSLHEQSMIPLIAGILHPVRHHPVIIELCFGFFHELCKVQFLVADGDKYEDNVCGMWSDIYRQILSNPAIKPRAVNWSALESHAKALLAIEES
ncbi:ORF21 [Retroperitoneal fibromatosis-associated herpesvirus]|uniref:ORF21 n=1 Tax=Retroperitoneal fibromatosis-associated herpesvirus TaxID=111469 RepID=U5NIU8_9GAMA|nr:ORF21 [Retroperitoneal fibromatosis-associated herpesvirus]AGY30704.1 ORF21 [Retroperitoneal fibromatosis-associated herpesvirus]